MPRLVQGVLAIHGAQLIYNSLISECAPTLHGFYIVLLAIGFSVGANYFGLISCICQAR
jgi:hypothetical protein